MIARNIVANAVGGVLSIGLQLVLIPLQIRLLGAEAFGLLGLIATAQIVFGVFDLGLATTVTREIARDLSPGRQSSSGLVESLGTIYWIVAVVLGVVVFFSAGWIVNHWLKLQSLSPEMVRFALRIVAVVIALRWPVAFYAGILVGLQEIVTLNVLKSVSALIRLAGGLAVLLSGGDLTWFLSWLALGGFLELLLYAVTCFRLYPSLRLRPSLSVGSLAQIWRFSLGINVISILALVFTQADRVVMSGILPLAEIGYYSLAMTVVLSTSVVQGFITAAIMPAMATDHGGGRLDSMFERYQKATQIVIYILTLPTFIFIFFGKDVIRVWVSAQAAEKVAVLLAMLAIGFLLNAAVSVAYTLAVSTGNLRIPLRVNLIALVFYLPTLYFAVVRWGTVGAAAVWIGLNVGFVCTLLPIVERAILHRSVFRWFRMNFVPFIALALACFVLALYLARSFGSQSSNAPVFAGCAVASLIYGAGGFFLLESSLRKDIVRFGRSLIVFMKGARG